MDGPMTDRTDLDPADAPWVSILVRRLAAARTDGDEAEATRLLEYGRAENDGAFAEAIDQAISSAATNGAGAAGELICDFCAVTGPVVYYEVREFTIAGPGDEFSPGDRFYACPRCRQFIDAGDWKGLRAWIGPNQFSVGQRVLLVGFKEHRKGDAIEFEPGTNPEESRAGNTT
jgi:hypothetical protein